MDFGSQRCTERSTLDTRIPFGCFCSADFLRIFPTFLACSAIAYGTIAIGLGDLSRSQLENPFWTLRSLCLFGSSSLGYRLIETQWSLDIELQFYLLFPLLYAAWKRRSLALISTTIGCLVVFLIVLGLYHSLLVYLPFFLVGVAISETKLKTPNWMYWTLTIAIPVLMIVLWAIPESSASILESGTVFLFGTNVTRAVDVLIALLAVPFVAHNVKVPETRSGFHAGNLSFPLYLVHWILLGPYVIWYGQLRMIERLPYFFGYLCLSVLVSLVIYGLVDRPIDSWRKWVIQRRTKIHAKPVT